MVLGHHTEGMEQWEREKRVQYQSSCLISVSQPQPYLVSQTKRCDCHPPCFTLDGTRRGSLPASLL
jgi:hypothetical protein